MTRKDQAIEPAEEIINKTKQRLKRHLEQSKPLYQSSDESDFSDEEYISKEEVNVLKESLKIQKNKINQLLDDLSCTKNEFANVSSIKETLTSENEVLKLENKKLRVLNERLQLKILGMTEQEFQGHLGISELPGALAVPHEPVPISVTSPSNTETETATLDCDSQDSAAATYEGDSANPLREEVTAKYNCSVAASQVGLEGQPTKSNCEESLQLDSQTPLQPIMVQNIERCELISRNSDEERTSSESSGLRKTFPPDTDLWSIEGDNHALRTTVKSIMWVQKKQQTCQLENVSKTKFTSCQEIHKKRGGGKKTSDV